MTKGTCLKCKNYIFFEEKNFPAHSNGESWDCIYCNIPMELSQITNTQSSFLVQPKIISYRKEIRIVIKGKAPEPKDKEKDGYEPYLPTSFFEYIQSLAATYTRNYEKDGGFSVESLTIENAPT